MATTIVIGGGGGGGGQQQKNLSVDGKSVQNAEGMDVAIFTNRKDAIRYLKHMEAMAESGADLSGD